MRAVILLVVLMCALPTQLSGITTQDKSPKPIKSIETRMEEEISSSNHSDLITSERQRRLIPYMTFYLTRQFNRPTNHLQEPQQPPASQPPLPPPQQQYHQIPQKIIVQPYHGKIILVNGPPPKYSEPQQIVVQSQIPYTPFMESNKLPGGFTPIRNHQPIRVKVLNPPSQSQIVQEPNYSVIYDTLLQLKQMQYAKPQFSNVQPQFEPPKIGIANQYDRPKISVAAQYNPPKINVAPEYDNPTVANHEPPKVIQYESPKIVASNYNPQINTANQYEPNKINVASQYEPQQKYYTREYGTPKPPTKFIAIENYQPEQYKPANPTKTYIHTYTPSNIDISSENKVQNFENFESLKTYNQIPTPAPAVPQQIPVKIQTIPHEQFEQQNEEKNHYEPIIIRPVYQQQTPVKNYQTIYVQQEPQQEHQTVTPIPEFVPTENPHSLSVILKQLQDSNTLPQTLTPDNIDNSIKTLVHILNALKQTQKFQKPIEVVAQTDSEETVPESDDETEYEDDIVPGTVSHTYPAQTPEGGTPGKPGIDYPAYSLIPQTNFNCKKQRYKGFFGDPDTNCQVWHYCDLNGGQASFLCPNGTIFSQVALTCDWWYNVKCATTTQLYVLNERLYKYILPFTPKFPEDYSGPLVDRYLALKFKEMEEKMKKQKKGKTEKPADDDVQDSKVNTLEDIENDGEAETNESPTPVSTQEEVSE